MEAEDIAGRRQDLKFWLAETTVEQKRRRTRTLKMLFLSSSTSTLDKKMLVLNEMLAKSKEEQVVSIVELV